MAENECVELSGSRIIVDLVGLVAQYHRAFLSVTWVQNFFLWIFRGSTFLFQWLIPSFKDSQFLAASERVTENRNRYKYTSNRVFYSKSISAILSSVYFRKVLHLPNQLSYYAAFICTNCVLVIFFLQFQNFFSHNSNMQLLQKYYCYIDY